MKDKNQMPTNNLNSTLSQIVEAALLAYKKPLTIKKLQNIFEKSARPELSEIKETLLALQASYHGHGIELIEVASGWRFQVRTEVSTWVNRLWDEKTPKYSKAFLETIALIAYRQPITRGEIEDIRGVAVSSNIIKSMLERDWIRVLGQKETHGRPSMYGTTKQFLDYFSLKSLTELPSLMELEELGFAKQDKEIISSLPQKNTDEITSENT